MKDLTKEDLEAVFPILLRLKASADNQKQAEP